MAAAVSMVNSMEVLPYPSGAAQHFGYSYSYYVPVAAAPSAFGKR